MYALLSSGVLLLVYFVVNLQYFNIIPETETVGICRLYCFFLFAIIGIYRIALQTFCNMRQ